MRTDEGGGMAEAAGGVEGRQRRYKSRGEGAGSRLLKK